MIGEDLGYDGPVLVSGASTTQFTSVIVVDDPEQEAFVESFEISVSSPNGNPTRFQSVNVALP